MVAPFQLDSIRDPARQPADAPAQPQPPRGARGEHAVHSHRRRRRRPRRLLLALVVLALVATAAGVFVGVRLHAPDPVPAVTPDLARTVQVQVAPGAPLLPWPQTGQAAVAVPAVGLAVSSGPEQPVPVASLTKLMTAYVVLHDHPLITGQAGPTLTVTQADVVDYDQVVGADGSNAAVTLGEQLSEEQVMSGLLVHSADNYADLVARWDAGSIPAFVSEMNADAARLGMTQTHFADPSGLDPGSTSTASDMLKIAARDMGNPVFAAMVKMPSVTLPVAGTLRTYTPFIGLQGVLGVKSGFTPAAGGCDVLAAVRTLHGRPTLLLAAVMGQTGPDVLAQAGLHGLALVGALAPLLGTTTAVQGGQLAARVSEAGRTVAATASSPATVLSWPGDTVVLSFRPRPGLTDRARRGAVVGDVVATLGTQRVEVPVRVRHDVPRPTLLQRLF